jgi:hypothetical protein
MQLASAEKDAEQLIAWRYVTTGEEVRLAQVSVRRSGGVIPSKEQGFPRSVLLADALDHGMSGGPLYCPRRECAVGVLVEWAKINPYALARRSGHEEDTLVDALSELDVGFGVDASIPDGLLAQAIKADAAF